MLLASLNYALSLGFGVTFLLAGLVAAALLHTFRNLAGHRDHAARRGRDVRRRRDPVHARAAWRALPRAPTSASRAGEREAGGRHRRRTQRCTVTLDVRRADARAASRSDASRCRRTFPLGLWRGWAYVHFPLAGIVFPAAGDRRRRRCRAAAAAPIRSRKAASDDADLAGLREFQPGDPPQRVAWKAVARGAGWFTQAIRRRRRRRPGRARRGTRCRPRCDVEARLVAPDRVGARGGARGAAVLALRCRARAARAARAAIIAAQR